MKKILKVASGLLVFMIVIGIIFINKTASSAVTEPDEKDQEAAYCVVSQYSVPYTLDDLIEQSNLVVRGTVKNISDPFMIRGVNGIGELTYTDYDIDVSEVVRGNLPSDTRSVVVRMEGDPSNNLMIYESAPILDKEREYLLFLQKPGMGGGFNTEGDYYYILGLRQGVYENAEQENVLLSEDNADKVFISQEIILSMENPEEGVPQIHRQEIDVAKMSEENTLDGGILRWNKFTEMVADIEAVHPVDENLRRKEVESNYKTNLETGMLTEEEYRQLMDELDEYAEIVK